MPVNKRLFFGNRVDTAPVPGMASDDSLQREQSPPHHAEAVDRKVRIFAAARVESAPSLAEDGSEYPVVERESFLIYPDTEKDNFFHSFLVNALYGEMTVERMTISIFLGIL
jgi:hypothetical protein